MTGLSRGVQYWPIIFLWPFKDGKICWTRFVFSMCQTWPKHLFLVHERAQNVKTDYACQAKGKNIPRTIWGEHGCQSDRFPLIGKYYRWLNAAVNLTGKFIKLSNVSLIWPPKIGLFSIGPVINVRTVMRPKILGFYCFCHRARRNDRDRSHKADCTLQNWGHFPSLSLAHLPFLCLCNLGPDLEP